VATSAATATARPASTVRGAIHAKSVPPGAAVWLDGKDTGIVTNNLLSDVELGRHQVTLRLADHEPATTEVEVDDTKVAPHSVTLSPSKVRLTVSSDPDGAQVFLDDARRDGATPCFVPDVPCGTHRLRLEKGDLFFEGDVRVTMAAPTVQQKLAPREVRVSFKSTPLGAKVYCDALGLKGERVTPFEQAVRVGEYLVSFVAKGFRKATLTARPGDAQGSEVAAKLEPEQATVRIVVSPKDARVTVNGTAVAAASLSSYPVSPGEVRVVATRSGYQTASQTLTVVDRDAKPVNLILAEKPKGAEPGQPFENSLGMKLVWLVPGTFQMGSPDGEPGRDTDEGPVHTVRIMRGFWMSTTEVTQGEWEAVRGSNPSRFKGSRKPVEQVSWDDCQDFCRKLTEREQAKGTLPQGSVYRLPTEAEWEYACRSGTRTALYTGSMNIVGKNNAPALDPIAWYGGNSGTDDPVDFDSSGWPEKQYQHTRAGTHVVAQKRANAWGLYDMLGNVLEWCQDGKRPYSAES
jgi:formylglycine-generating enzyme required for sulfatase activity